VLDEPVFGRLLHPFAGVSFNCFRVEVMEILAPILIYPYCRNYEAAI
jgi:hypothetical protein